MSHIPLFHSALGLQPGIYSFAEQLRQTGHTVVILIYIKVRYSRIPAAGNWSIASGALVWHGFWVWRCRRGRLREQAYRFLLDDLIYRFEEIVIDLLFPEVHPALGIEAVERG